MPPGLYKMINEICLRCNGILRPECLSAKDVLAHLNSLGYHDISSQQLKEFLHDLKKLIKYEQKRAQQNCHKIKSGSAHPSECGCSCPAYDNTSDKSSSNESYCESSISHSTADTLERSNLKLNEINKQSARNPSDFDSNSQTVHTSFIRPWNLQASKDLSGRKKRNLDPVKLYHQYKEFWKNQNIPGESKHSELRWIVRNKMMGQEPHPRVFISNHKYF